MPNAACGQTDAFLYRHFWRRRNRWVATASAFRGFLIRAWFFRRCFGDYGRDGLFILSFGLFGLSLFRGC